MKVISENRKARHEYFIIDSYEAGIKLTGTEIKSVRLNNVNINDAYVQIKGNRVYIINMHIAKYEKGNIFNHDETRTRELLLNKRETLKLFNKCKLEGMTIIPTKVYMKEALCKIEISLCKGKHLHDKRQALKEEDAKRRMQKVLKEMNY